MHHRECYVVLKEGADPVRVEREIREMPHYFKGYETKVHFISRDELVKSHGSMAHGGRVIRCGRTGGLREHLHSAELSLSLESNPEFTACMLAATARAAHRLYLDGERGCKTLFDIPPRYLSPISAERLISELL
jgi:diaminopimelate dehydrogenase